jgi:hypothetical protein
MRTEEIEEPGAQVRRLLEKTRPRLLRKRDGPQNKILNGSFSHRFFRRGITLKLQEFLVKLLSGLRLQQCIQVGSSHFYRRWQLLELWQAIE